MSAESALLIEPQPKRPAMSPSPVSSAAEAPKPVGLGVRFDHLDGIRALAAAYVVLVHHVTDLYSKDQLIFPHLPYWFQFGHYAVDVFIVLSGYCLMLPVARNHENHLRSGVVEYLRRRALRILPPYFAALGLSLLVLWGVGQLKNVTTGSLLSHLFLIHNFSPAWVWGINPPMWSVAVEWQIYFFFPFLLLPIRKRLGDIATILVAFVIGMLPHVLLHKRWDMDWSYPWYLGLFAMGMMAAGMSYQRLGSGETSRRKIYGSLSLAFFIIALLGTIRGNVPVHHQDWLYQHSYSMDAVLGLGTCMGLAWAGRHCMQPEVRHPFLIRALSAKPLVWVGMFSYSLYLIHEPVWLAVQPLVNHAHPGFRGEMCIRLFAGIPLVIGCSYLFFLAVEKPSMQLRSRKPKRTPPTLPGKRPLNIFVHRASECLTDYFPNGDGLICFSILGELARRGHRIFAYTNRDEVKNRPANLQIRAQHHKIPANSLADHEHAWRAARWLRQIERTEKIDLVWRMQPLGESCPTVPFTNGHPLVLGPLFHAWPKESVPPNPQGKPRLGLGIRTLISPIANRGWAKALQAASLVMCTTDVLADLTRPKTSGQVTTVPVIVDAPANLAIKPRPILPGTLKLLFVANLYANKNPLIFCQAIAGLRHRGVNAVGEILGDGPERKSMEDWCQTNGIADAITFAGRIPNAEVYQHLADADGLVSTSLGEPYGRGIAEGMSVGAVPICHRSGGPADFIRHGTAGILVDRLDGNDYADAIFQIWNNSGAWQRLSSAAVEQSLQWTTAAVIDRVEESLYELLRQEQPR